MRKIQPEKTNPPLDDDVHPLIWATIRVLKHLLVASALFLLICIAFANSFKSGMVLDNRYIIEEYYKQVLHDSPDLDLKSWQQIKTLLQHDYWWPKGISGLYRPITTLSYWVDYAILSDKPDKVSWSQYTLAPHHQLDTTSYHWINLLLHWTNALLVYGLGLVLFKRIWQALAGAALFALHPITTESVTNIIGRADLLAAISIFGGLLLYIHSTKSRGLWRLPWLIALMLLCAFGFFAKESAVAIGAIVPLYWLIFEFDWKKPTWLKSLGIEFLAWCFMLPPLIAMLGVRWWVYKNTTPVEEPFIDNPIRGIWQVAQLNIASFNEQLARKPMLGTSFLECKMTAVKAMGKLLTLLIWPTQLSCDYSYNQISNFSWHLQRWSDWQAIMAMLAILALLVLAARMFRRNRVISFSILFFFAAALPTSNIFVTIGSIMAERFMYVPLAGFAMVLVILVFALSRRIFRATKLPDLLGTLTAVIILAGICTAYAIRTYLRNSDWESDVTLWTAAQKVCPQSFRCYQSLAYALYEQDSIANVDKMIWLDEQGLAIVDPLPDHLNSSRLYLHLGQFDSIKADLLRTKNSDGSSTNLSDAQQIYDKSIATLQRGVQIDRAFNEVNRAKQIQRGDKPQDIADTGYDVLYHEFATVYARIGAFDDAIRMLNYELHLQPTNSDAYFDIGNLQLAQRKYDDAAVSMIESIIIDSNHPQPWQALRSIYSEMGSRAAGAFAQENGRLQLNIHQPLVQEQITSACRNLIRISLSARVSVLADQIHELAIQRYQLPSSLFDPLFNEPPMIVTPY